MKYSKYIVLSLFFFWGCKSNNLVVKLQNLDSQNNLNQLFSNQLSLLTFNAWALPINLKRFKKRSRYPRIPILLDSLNTDIVCLQEIFDPTLRDSLLAEFENKYYYNKDYHCTKKILALIKRDCFGGLLTFSKLPIIKNTFYQHENLKGMRIDEKLGNKGFLITLIESNSGIVCIVNTHLYSGRTLKDESYRVQQLEKINNVIVRENLNKYPIILIGDFNIVHEKLTSDSPMYRESIVYKTIVKKLKYLDVESEASSNHSETGITYNSILNPLADKSEGVQKLDYCFLKLPISYRLSNSSSKVIFNDPGNLISDHYGLLSTITINNE